MSGRSYLSIGEVLSLLRKEFPDVTISKIRFLESQGLVNPERTPSGYRKFYDHDIERLGWVLRQQREHFLPLKIIKNRLEGEARDDAGVDCPAVGEEADAAAAIDSAHMDPGWSADADVPILVGQTSRRAAGSSAPAVTTGPGSVLPEIDPSDASAPASPQNRRASPNRRPAIFSGAGTVPTVDDRDQGPQDASGPIQTRPAALGDQAPPPTRLSAGRTVAKTTAAKTGRGSGSDAVRPAKGAAAAPSLGGISTGSSMSMSAEELAAASGLTPDTVAALQEFGLLGPSVVAGGVPYYDEEALVVAKLAIELAQFGIEPRHLRLYKNAVDREVSFIEQIVTPLLRQRNPDARLRAAETIDQMAHLGQALRSSLLRTAFRNQIGS